MTIPRIPAPDQRVLVANLTEIYRHGLWWRLAIRRSLVASVVYHSPYWGQDSISSLTVVHIRLVFGTLLYLLLLVTRVLLFKHAIKRFSASQCSYVQLVVLK